MLSAIFGPDPTRRLAAHDLAALPATWMTAACMDGRFRRLSGWLGFGWCTSAPKSWTCRLAAYKGVFGVLPVAANADAEPAAAAFRLFYFPAADDPLLDSFSLSAAIAASAPEALAWIRDFPSRPEAAEAFCIAEMRLVLAQPALAVGLALEADLARRVAAPDGIAAPAGGWIVPPGGLEEDLPAFAIARGLFRVLAAGLAAATGSPPGTPRRRTAPAAAWEIRGGALVPAGEIPGGRVTEALSWGAADACPGALPAPEEAGAYRLARLAAGAEAPDAAEIVAADRPQLIVLSGFLGSGKTSFLNQFIEFQAAHDRLVGVIQNELGETGVDAKMLEGDDSVLAIDAGCVCCTLAGSLTRGLRSLAETLKPEIVVLETTGLANPLNMLAEFAEIGDIAELSAVVAVVDAALYRQSLAASEVAGGQIAAADTVVLNKCDLVDAPTRAAIAADIRRRNPGARIVEAEFGRVNPVLFSEGLSRHAATDQPCPVCGCGHDPAHLPHDHGPSQACDCQDHDRPPHHRHHDHAHHRHHDHAHGHAVTHLDEGFSAIRLTLAPAVARETLDALLAACPPSVFRVKGIARLTGVETPQVVQYVPGRYDCRPTEKADDTPPFLLVIGRGLNEEEVRRHWRPLIKE
ncbi:CobW family GTP-binding protein [Oleispirillum naphthae]|uniref:CobW family GTP-binding protein n=1 Tax=Oleispirillum naphthae TaxID=2838853 RepID=UPI0030825D11